MEVGEGNRYEFFEKEGVGFGIISMAVIDSVEIVGMTQRAVISASDSRHFPKATSARAFESREEAEIEFGKAITKTRDRGWRRVAGFTRPLNNAWTS